MSWQTMALELTGQTPVPLPFAQTLVNRAWSNIQRDFLWSFLWDDAAVPTPFPTQTGTVTLTVGSPTVVLDAAAQAAWAALPIIFAPTLQQFRVGQGTIYNVIQYVAPNATLDRPYVDPTAGAGVSYQLFQTYYNAPAKDFLWWESLRDPISGYTFKTTLTREYVDMLDPQRFQSGWPEGPIPYRINSQAGNFFQYPMYEIWPAPLNNYTYVGTYFRKGLPFVNLTDTINGVLDEELVIEQAKICTYEWCIVNPEKVPRGDYRFALGKCQKDYQKKLDQFIRMDLEFSHRHIIDMPQESYISRLPWVSAKAGLLFAP